MNPLAKRISLVEFELAELTDTARKLTATVADLKSEIMQEEVTSAESLTVPLILPTPPPLPEPVVHENLPEQESFVKQEVAVPQKFEESKSREEVSDLEMHLGRVWSVRLGIVLLTTGFVFLSRYTYDSFIRDLGPGVRLTMMYLLSFVLTGAGLFCERWKDNLKNYGRIVAAGGLAAIYYCGFAAHNVEALKVIQSPVTASLVLFISAGAFCAISVWRESRVMLSTSLALAFYSTSVNPIGWMACLSAIILAAFGIGMMIRHRWIEVGFLVLVGCYLSFIWWQFAVAQGASTMSHWFLVAYWLLFAAASLVPQRALDEDKHLLFTSLNNGAFFLLFSFRMETGDWMNQHWLFCFIFGATLIALYGTTKNLFPERSRVVHLVKGSGLITLGLALLLDGHQLFVALLIEALVLMTINLKFPHLFTRASSWAVGLLSCTALVGVSPGEVHVGVWLFAIIAWLALGTMDRWIERNEEGPELRTCALVASFIALVFFIFGFMSGWTHLQKGMTLGTIGTITCFLTLLKTCRSYVFEMLAVFTGAGFIALATLFSAPAIGLSTLLVAATLALASSVPLAIASCKSEQIEQREGLHLFSGAFLALALGFVWLALDRSELSTLPKLVIILAIPILGTITARSTQLLAHSVIPFSMYLAVLSVGSLEPTALFLGFAMTAGHLALVKRSQALPDHEVLASFLLLFASAFWGLWLVAALSHPAIPLTLTAIALLLAMRYFGEARTLLIAAPFYALGVVLAFLEGWPLEVYLSLAPALIFHLSRTFRKSKKSYPPMAIVSLLALWAQITIDTSTLPLAAAWAISGTVFLLTGLAFKSRCFRLIGLVILACSLGHLMLIDLIKLDPLPRILSFMTLGLGLLGLGFVYNRWQDRLKQIL